MSPAVTNLMEKIDERVLRERALIFITALAVIFFLWSFLVQARFDTERKKLQEEESKLSLEKVELVSKISAITTAMASDPAVAKSHEVNKLNSDINEIEEKLSGLSQGLISAGQLPKVLEDVLLRTKSVKLLQVRTLAATELQLSATKTDMNSDVQASTGGTGVYKHSVLIRVVGNYSQLIQLMEEIEALQWKFYWESLDYSVKKYPAAEIDIRVFTLSSEEGLFGV